MVRPSETQNWSGNLPEASGSAGPRISILSCRPVAHLSCIPKKRTSSGEPRAWSPSGGYQPPAFPSPRPAAVTNQFSSMMSAYVIQRSPLRAIIMSQKTNGQGHLCPPVGTSKSCVSGHPTRKEPTPPPATILVLTVKGSCAIINIVNIMKLLLLLGWSFCPRQRTTEWELIIKQRRATSVSSNRDLIIGHILR